MKRLLATAAATTAAFAIAAPSANATIHPIMLGWLCGNASGEPPGQTPGATPGSDQSEFRALQATGVLTITASGEPVFDLTKPAAKFYDFHVQPEEGGTPRNPAAISCSDLRRAATGWRHTAPAGRPLRRRLGPESLAGTATRDHADSGIQVR